MDGRRILVHDVYGIGVVHAAVGRHFLMMRGMGGWRGWRRRRLKRSEKRKKKKERRVFVELTGFGASDSEKSGGKNNNQRSDAVNR